MEDLEFRNGMICRHFCVFYYNGMICRELLQDLHGDFKSIDESAKIRKHPTWIHIKNITANQLAFETWVMFFDRSSSFLKKQKFNGHRICCLQRYVLNAK